MKLDDFVELDGSKLLLVPTDFSEASTVALSAAVTLAQTFHAAIELLHVVLDSALILPPLGDIIAMLTAMESVTARAAGELERTVARVREENIVCTGASESARSCADIVEHAVRIGAGLIVLGSHGRHGQGHLLLSSSAEKVAQDAPCAVLVVPALRETQQR